MKKRDDLIKLALSAVFLALAYVLPFLTGQIQQIGNMLLPMHIPVILCGFICGAPWGAVVGFCAPILRSLILGMPPFFPTAVSMAFELCTYGFMTGFLFKLLPSKKINIYVSLIASMLAGRAVWGIAQFVLLGFDVNEFGISAFVAGAFTNAVPGIILQIVAIPILVMLLTELRKKKFV